MLVFQICPGEYESFSYECIRLNFTLYHTVSFFFYLCVCVRRRCSRSSVFFQSWYLKLPFVTPPLTIRDERRHRTHISEYFTFSPRPFPRDPAVNTLYSCFFFPFRDVPLGLSRQKDEARETLVCLWKDSQRGVAFWVVYISYRALFKGPLQVSVVSGCIAMYSCRHLRGVKNLRPPPNPMKILYFISLKVWSPTWNQPLWCHIFTLTS